jgi:hypothetical protein
MSVTTTIRSSDTPRRSLRRTAHDPPDAILIADAADLAVGEIDLDHVLRRAPVGWA